MGVLSTLFLAFIMAAAPATPAKAAAATASQPEDAVASLPAYDVVSIKPNHTGTGNWNIDSSNGDYLATNVSVKTLLESAYDIKEELISGISGPMESARFDVHAKIVDPDKRALRALSNKQRGAMLLPFLEERFHLKAHVETKTLAVFELVVTKDGPKFKSSAKGDEGGTSVQSNNNKTELTATAVSMVSLARTLTNEAHRNVIDETGLTGLYDLQARWSPQDIPSAPSQDGSTSQNELGPSLFTALQEQLGLKLRSGKGPVDTLVVDHVEMPSAN